MLYQKTLVLGGPHAASDVVIASADPGDYIYYPEVAHEGLPPVPLSGPVCW
jgi:hypothetical protein